MVPKSETKLLTCRQRTLFPVTQPLVLPAVGHVCPCAHDAEVGVQADVCLLPCLAFRSLPEASERQPLSPMTP